MEFDKSKVYTAVNADELKVGSKIFVAYDLATLKLRVSEWAYVRTFERTMSEGYEERIKTKEDTEYYPLAYLVSEPEEKKLKWTELKIGDVISKTDKRGLYIKREVIGIDDCGNSNHIVIYDGHLSDLELEEWKKVKK